MGVFWRGLVYLFKDFSCWTSTHGVPHIGMANAMWLRLFWLIVVAACLLGFLIQLKLLVTKYLSYGVNTETLLDFSAITFPAVTICNLNPWKLNEVQASPYMAAMIAAYQDRDANANFGFTQGRNGQRQSTAVRLTALANDHLFAMANGDNDTASPAYSYSDLVISCTYNSDDCNLTTLSFSDWQSYEDPNYGLCQTYNFKQVEQSSRAGSLYGLQVVLRTEQDLYLPWTEAAGVVVSIHNSSIPPYPDVLGYYAPPGVASYMGVVYSQSSLLSAPYGDCTTATTMNLTHYSGPYEVETCFRSCIQDQIISQCGCYDPTYPFMGNTSTPSCFGEASTTGNYKQYADNMACITPISMQSNTSQFEVIRDCPMCLQPCAVQTYSVTYSAGQWPSPSYVPSECSSSSQAGQPWYVAGTDAGNQTDNCMTWYSQNTVLVEIYYEQMDYEVLTESPSYTFVSLISDVGGQLGLFLGVSIISAIELFTLIILLIYYVASHRARRVEMENLDEMAKLQQKHTEELRQRVIARAERKQREKEERERRRHELLNQVSSDEEGAAPVAPAAPPQATTPSEASPSPPASAAPEAPAPPEAPKEMAAEPVKDDLYGTTVEPDLNKVPAIHD